MKDDFKMYCVFARETVQLMEKSRGKMCAQAGHAFLHAAQVAAKHFPQDLEAYLNSNHAYKIVLIVDTVEELKNLQRAYQDVCATVLIVDKAFTVFDIPTVTCLGIGPLPNTRKGDDLHNLKLFN